MNEPFLKKYKPKRYKDFVILDHDLSELGTTDGTIMLYDVLWDSGGGLY